MHIMPCLHSLTPRSSKRCKPTLLSRIARGWLLLVQGFSLTINCPRPKLQAVKKDVLKTCGIGWLGSVAMHLYNAHEGTQKKEIAYGCAALGAVMGAICMWRGCKKVEEEEEAPSKK